jgi:hypothetical protein
MRLVVGPDDVSIEGGSPEMLGDSTGLWIAARYVRRPWWVGRSTAQLSDQQKRPRVGGQTQMVVKMVVRPIAKLSEEA